MARRRLLTVGNINYDATGFGITTILMMNNTLFIQYAWVKTVYSGRDPLQHPP
ncbi:hypothetical protein [Microcoleus sp. OTE_8_concoct_300]|uniref:hypothetical protein n=1 Tax=Microcoleus sp. OTE_8_concoct_300 TaxID=2964710 RepID=UPI00403F801D